MKKAIIVGFAILTLSSAYADRGVDSLYESPEDFLRNVLGEEVHVGPSYQTSVQKLAQQLSGPRHPGNEDIAKEETHRLLEAQAEATAVETDTTLSIIPLHTLNKEELDEWKQVVVIKPGTQIPSADYPETKTEKAIRLSHYALQGTATGLKWGAQALGTGTFGLVSGAAYGVSGILDAGSFVSPYAGKAGKFVWEALSEGADALSNKSAKAVTEDTSLIGKAALRITSAASSVASLAAEGMAKVSEFIGDTTPKVLGFLSGKVKAFASGCLNLAKRIWNS